MEEVSKEVLERIVTARQEKKYSQYNMADFLGMHQSNYMRIERGQTRITLDLFMKIAAILDKPAVWFFATADLQEKGATPVAEPNPPYEVKKHNKINIEIEGDDDFLEEFLRKIAKKKNINDTKNATAKKQESDK